MPNSHLLKQLFRNNKHSDHPGFEAVAQPIIAEERQKNHRKLRTSAEEAQGAATEFLLDHVGHQLLAGQAHLMVSATEATWVVPIHLSYLPTGPIGSAGVVAIDDETGLDAHRPNESG
ncbi:MAG: hypothetical protein R3E79_51470 [Caldilineaceae bacterium]